MRGEAPRALIDNFHTDYARRTLLRYSKYLEETDFDSVLVMPDLTKKQRAEESSMEEEVATRNEKELTEEDV